MFARQIAALVAASIVGVFGCGSADEGEPLLSGSMTAEYDGHSFMPEFGFAATNDADQSIIVVGDGPIHCGSENDNDPPAGYNASINVPMLEAGSHSVLVQLFQNVDEFEGVGSAGGNLTLIDVSAESVAGSIEFDYTTEGRHFSLSGTFEVVNCSG